VTHFDRDQLISECRKFYAELYPEVDRNGFSNDSTKRDIEMYRLMQDSGFSDHEIFAIVNEERNKWIASAMEDEEFKPNHMAVYFR